jgi:hypothetical protein
MLRETQAINVLHASLFTAFELTNHALFVAFHSHIYHSPLQCSEVTRETSRQEKLAVAARPSDSFRWVEAYGGLKKAGSGRWAVALGILVLEVDWFFGKA